MILCSSILSIAKSQWDRHTIFLLLIQTNGSCRPQYVLCIFCNNFFFFSLLFRHRSIVFICIFIFDSSFGYFFFLSLSLLRHWNFFFFVYFRLVQCDGIEIVGRCGCWVFACLIIYAAKTQHIFVVVRRSSSFSIDAVFHAAAAAAGRSLSHIDYLE